MDSTCIMRFLIVVGAVLYCVGFQGCVSSERKLTPPDHVLDPRGN
jgi:hypothetical protein